MHVRILPLPCVQREATTYHFGAISSKRTSWELQDFIAAIFTVWPIRNSGLQEQEIEMMPNTGSPWLAPDLGPTSHGSSFISTTPVKWNNEAYRHLESVE
jgi:hypothetical protein